MMTIRPFCKTAHKVLSAVLAAMLIFPAFGFCAEDDEKAEIINFDTAEKCTYDSSDREHTYFRNLDTGKSAFSVDENVYDESLGNTMSAKWDLALTTNARLGWLSCKSIITDWTAYKAFNIRLRSVDCFGAKILLRAVCAQADAGGNVYYNRQLTLANDGSWETVSIKFDDFTKSSSKVSWADIQGIQLVNTGTKSGTINIDSMWLGSDTQWSTVISSDEYVIDGNQICGFGDRTVARIMNGLVVPNGASVEAYFEDGTRIANLDKSCDYGMYFEVTSANGQRSEKYFPAYQWFKAGDISCKVNGVAANGKFAPGILEATIEITRYAGENSCPFLAAAAYENGVLSNIYVSNGKPTVLKQKTVITLSADIPKCDSVKIFAFESAKSLEPIAKCVTLNPYSESRIEEFSYLFPGYTSKAVTFSYDDGLYKSDEQLAALFRENGLAATFNLVGKNFYTTNAELIARYKAIYDGFEVANHSYDHYRMNLTEPTVIDGTTVEPYTLEQCEESVTKGREWIEEKFGTFDGGYGFVWPFSTPINRSDYDELLDYIKRDGAKYIRPVTTTGNFELPSDWYDWSPTCHHDKAMQYVDKFLNEPNGGDLKLFFVWGHSKELANETASKLNWDTMAQFLEKFRGRDDIWSATNMQIYDYVEALRSLEVDYDNLTVTNKSPIDLYVRINGENKLIAAHSDRTAIN